MLGVGPEQLPFQYTRHTYVNLTFLKKPLWSLTPVCQILLCAKSTNDPEKQSTELGCTSSHTGSLKNGNILCQQTESDEFSRSPTSLLTKPNALYIVKS